MNRKDIDLLAEQYKDIAEDKIQEARKKSLIDTDPQHRESVGKLAIQILMDAELDDDSENGFIRVNPDLLFRFYTMHNTVQ